MRLESVYARFFRSLNYDYLRKSDPGYVAAPWDETPAGQQYPFVRVRLERDITTVVGANESGKSQLLGALKRGLTGDGIVARDFCRYSPFFSRESTLRLPEFGLGFCDLDADDCAAIARMCELDAAPSTTECALFRMNAAPKTRLYVRADDGTWAVHGVKKPTLLKDLGVPSYFEIDSDVPLPDSVPLDYLATGRLSGAAGRDSLRRTWDLVREHAGSWFSSAKSVETNAEQIQKALAPPAKDARAEQMYKLADDLLIKVSGLTRELFDELRSAIADGKNGYAGGIVDTINDEIAKSLNFPHWWSQDSNFELFVDLREYDLVFNIRDRTGTSYSFDERSAGMKYFLSYFVQFKSHEPPKDGQPELLLMDEPDAYLSSSGQQDLLRIFDAFAWPDNPARPPVQVVYVTHSPFLIDKNHAGRIRVLEKGEHDEGTRVVGNASRNHYEPLRSAFGSFVGETAFIGTCNLLLEGPSDQVLLAGISRWLRERGAPDTERLDLNGITLVPAAGAAQVPYLAFLARGRDVDRPAVIVLLDGDKPGTDARNALARGGPRGKELVPKQFVVQLTDPSLEGIQTENPVGPVQIEDLVPLTIATAAVRLYCNEFVPEIDLEQVDFAVDGVVAGGYGVVAGLERAVRATAADFHLDKIGFARSVIDVIRSDTADAQGIAVFEANFKRLLSELRRMQRAADRQAGEEKIRSRINRARRRFQADHPHGARREHVSVLTEEIENQLDSSLEAEEVRAAMRKWVPRFKLDDNPRADVDDYPAFLAELERLAYAGERAAQESGRASVRSSRCFSSGRWSSAVGAGKCSRTRARGNKPTADSGGGGRKSRPRTLLV